jgi:hypothetical protein
MSKENGARRNRALRKVRQCPTLPAEVKATIEVLLDHMNKCTGYDAAWASVATIARTVGRDARTVRWHLQAIKQTGIFLYHYFSPKDATRFLLQKYGVNATFNRCSHQAPTIYRVNPKHWLWDTKRKVAPHQSDELSKTVKDVFAKRNRSKTRSSQLKQCLRNGKQVAITESERRSRYDISSIRKGLEQFTRRTDAAEQSAFTGQSNVVDDMPRDVASDMTGNVVDDSQVLEKQKELAGAPSSCPSSVTPPTHRFLEALQLAPVASFMGAATAAPRGGLRTTTEVDKSPSVVLLRPHPKSPTEKQELEDEYELEFDLEKMTDEEIAEFCKDLESETEVDDDPYDDLKDLSFRHSGLLDTSSMEHP